MNTEITRKFGAVKITFLSFLFLSLLAATPATYASSQVISAHGGMLYTNTLISINVGLHKTTILVNFTKVMSGTIQGTIKGIQVIYKYPDGTTSSQYIAVFSGTIGSSAAGTAVVHGRISIVKTLEAVLTFNDGTGGLVGLKGSIEVDSSVAPFNVATYDGTFTL